MIAVLEQVFSLLTTELGGLAYHLVLAFCVAGALQMTFNQPSNGPRLARLRLGLLLLLILQLLSFAASGLVWQGLITAEAWLPPLDRAVNLFSLVVIIWLWAFPDPSPSADAGALLVGLLVSASAVLGALWWSQGDAYQSFNGSPPDIAAQVIALLLLGLGALLLVVRQPEGWGSGLWMLALLAAGNSVHLLVMTRGGDYSGAGRLLQMAAYPFLLALPGRFPLQSATPQPAVPTVAADPLEALEPSRVAGAAFANPELWSELLKLSAEDEPGRLCKSMVSMLAGTMGADYCLLFKPQDPAGSLGLLCGYSAAGERYLEPASFPARSLPILSASMRMGRPRRLSGANASPDLAALANALDLKRTGNLLFMPVLSSLGDPEIGFLLLAPFSGKDWSGEDQSYLAVLARLLVRFLQHSQEMAALKLEIAQAQDSARLAQDRMSHITEETQKLRGQLAVLKEQSGQDQLQLASMTALVSSGLSAQQTLDQLQVENQQLTQQLTQAAQLAAQEDAGQDQPLEGELRLALQEVALLSAALDEAESKIASVKMSASDAAPSNEQAESLIVISQDLRGPLSSVVGYTDFLLGESVGILGAVQRKYLERIKVSTVRMGALLDDLIQVTSLDASPSQLDLQEVDLCDLINAAIQDSAGIINQAEVNLILELPAEPLPITTDQHTLRRVLGQLINNASAVTPPGGDITVSARLEGSETDLDYVLIQVADGGPGISPSDLPRLFSPSASSDEIAGIGGEGVDLPNVKALIQLLGGRTWVDSEQGSGAIFSLLLPVLPALLDENISGLF